MPPSGSTVDKVYQALLRKGKSKATAAKISQAVTRLSLQSGKPPKHSKYNAKKRLPGM